MRKIFTAFFLLLSIGIFAQTGKITGKIISSKTGEPLVSASIAVEGTSRAVVSDLNGVYTISGLTPGTYKITSSYVSFSKKIVSEVSVKANEVTQLTISLDEATAANQGIVITTRRNRENVGSLLVAQKNSASVSDGVSAETIRKTPDRNTSDVLKRVSGASIQDDRFVIIRGLNDRYNAAFLNGAPLPSSESDRKAFAFDIFPSNILDNIVIYKTASADMSGEFAGGLINITTKSIPAQNFTTLSLGLGYNTLTTFKNRVDYNKGKWDFIGLDDGTRKLPSQIPGIAEFKNLDPTAKASYARYFSNNWALKNKSSLPYANLQLTKGLNISKQGKDFLGMLFSLTYNKNAAYSDGDRNTFDYDRASPSGAPEQKEKYFDKIYYDQTLLGALANFSMKLSNRSTLNFKNIFSVNSDDRVVKREGNFDYSDPTSVAIRNGRWFTSNLIYSTQLSGSHVINKSNFRIDWLGGYSLVKRSVPDLRQSLYVYNTASTDPATAVVSSGRPVPQDGGTHFFSTTNENIVSAKVDFTQPFILRGNKQSLLKFGLNLQSRKRDFTARLLGFTTGSNFDYSLLTLPENMIFAPANLGGPLANGMNGFGLDEGSEPTYIYNASSRLGAGYAMLDQRLGNRIRAIYGVRLEDYNQKLNSTDENLKPVKLDATKLDILPSLNLVYSLTSKQNLRFAFSKTINRPEFRELAPFIFYDFITQYTIEGNPDLLRSSIKNYDLRYEFYPGKSQLFSLSGFYKDFANPIELVSNPDGNKQAIYQNAKSAKVYGAEAEVRSLLGTLAGSSEESFFNKLTISANAAVVWSEIKLGNFGLIDVKNLIAKRNLQGQSPYVFNSSLVYADENSGVSATLSANRVGPRIYIVGTVKDVDIYEQGRTVMDFQLAKSFQNNKWEIKLNTKDMLRQKQVYFYDIDQNKKYNKSLDKIFSRNTFGSVISLTGTYKF